MNDLKEKKRILIINGSGGVGKDTFVNQLKEIIPTYHYSIVEPVKFIASYVGWNGSKTETDRKFLSDLKVLVDNYSDYNYKSVLQIINDFYEDRIDTNILCIDMREKNQIERLKTEHNVYTVLIKRDSVPHITSNIADANVFDIDYDYVIENNGTIEELYNTAAQFVKQLYRP
jgi:dephospho-CoA kinase